MIKNKYLNQKGFTLVEIIVTVSIFTVLIFVISAMLNDIFSKSNQQLMSIDNIDQARAVASTLTNEIRNASTGSDGSYPLNQAGDSQIIFFSNYRMSDAKIARIRYYISENTLYKGIILPTGSPLKYDLSLEAVKPVVGGLSDKNSKIFYYYDSNYNGNTSALPQPVNINNVRFVKIDLSVLNQITSNSTSTFSITAGSTIRSIKDNLGN